MECPSAAGANFRSEHRHADSNIGDEAKACSFDDLASEPPRNKANHQDDE
jgi:hypothetical protein